MQGERDGTRQWRVLTLNIPAIKAWSLLRNLGAAGKHARQDQEDAQQMDPNLVAGYTVRVSRISHVRTASWLSQRTLRFGTRAKRKQLLDMLT